MRIQAPVVWTSTVLISLLLGSCHAQKLNVHWGPQSMMYLKGKYGRRFVSEDQGVMKQAVQGWYAALGGIQRRRSLQLQEPSSHSVLVQFLEDR